ncbi:hypothetical protein JYU16_00465 [bacterium AH-315-M05]|nr:hypothetical protein [bacterium AH-315-M05]
MRYLRLTILTLTLTTLITSCKKDNGPIKTGTYNGNFIVEYISGTKTGETTVTLKKTKYSCDSGTDRIPAGGSGTYSMDNNKIIFTDENLWTANFDWGLILNGEYDYAYDGTNLTIWKDTQAGRYEYGLKRK